MNQSDLVKKKLAKIILKRKKRGELINLKTHCDGFRTHIKCKRTHDSYNDNRLFSDNVLTSTVLCHSCTLNINPTGIHRHTTHWMLSSRTLECYYGMYFDSSSSLFVLNTTKRKRCFIQLLNIYAANVWMTRKSTTHLCRSSIC